MIQFRLCTRVFIILACTLLLGIGRATGAELYLMKGLLTDTFLSDSALYRVSNAGLLEVDVLPIPRFTKVVVADVEVRTLAVGADQLKRSEVQIMSMNEPGRIRAFELTVANFGMARMHTVEAVPGRPISLVLELMEEDTADTAKEVKRQFKGLDLMSDRWVDVQPQIYRDVRIIGGARSREGA